MIGEEQQQAQWEHESNVLILVLCHTITDIFNTYINK